MVKEFLIMPQFSAKLFPLIKDNQELFDFYTQKALDGCWIMVEDQPKNVYVDRTLAKNLGQNFEAVELDRIGSRQASRRSDHPGAGASMEKRRHRDVKFR